MSWFSKLGNELTSLFKKVPSYENVALSTVTVAAPLVEGILAFADPTVAPAVDAVLDKIKVDLATVSLTLKDAGPTPTIVTALNSINTNLASIEQLMQIKDPATQQKVNALVQLLTGEFTAILTAISASPATA